MSQPLTVRRIGWTGYEITSEGGTRVIIDPYLHGSEGLISGLPESPITVKELAGADIVAVTHAGYDHRAQAIEIALAGEAMLISGPALSRVAVDSGVPAERSGGILPGCTIQHADVTMQDHYSLLNREEEREKLPLCADEQIGVIPWSPLARGRLTRDPDTTTQRSADDAFGETFYRQQEAERAIIEAVAAIADGRGVSRAQVALAWVSQHAVVSAPIVGVTKPHHLHEAIASLDVHLTDDEVARLEAPYLPQPDPGLLSPRAYLELVQPAVA